MPELVVMYAVPFGVATIANADTLNAALQRVILERESHGARYANPRPLANQLRGDAERDFHRQRQAIELELLTRLVIREPAGERCQLVPLHGQLLFQRRQGRLQVRYRGILCHDIGLGDRAQLELAPQNPRRRAGGVIEVGLSLSVG